jgi:hypothetical protein
MNAAGAIDVTAFHPTEIQAETHARIRRTNAHCLRARERPNSPADRFVTGILADTRSIATKRRTEKSPRRRVTFSQRWQDLVQAMASPERDQSRARRIDG